MGGWVSIGALEGRAVLVFDVGVLEDLDGADARDGVRIEHFEQKIHEHRIFVKPVAVVLLQSRLKVLQACVLLLENLLPLPTLHTENAHAKKLFAGLRLCTALKTHPERDAG